MRCLFLSWRFGKRFQKNLLEPTIYFHQAEQFQEFQPVERWIERALIQMDNGFRNLFQPLSDPIPVRRLQREDLENQHVERALRDRKPGR